MDSIYQDLIIGIATTILCAIGAYFLRRILHIDFFRYFRSKHRIHQAGIVTFFQNRFFLQKDVGTINDYIIKAKKSVKYVGMYLSSALDQQGISQTVIKQINNDVYFTFCIISLSNPYLPAYANFLGISEKELDLKINASFEALNQIRDSVDIKKRNRISIKEHNHMVTTSYWVIDEQVSNSLMQIDHKIITSARMDSYCTRWQVGMRSCDTGSSTYSMPNREMTIPQ